MLRVVFRGANASSQISNFVTFPREIDSDASLEECSKLFGRRAIHGMHSFEYKMPKRIMLMRFRIHVLGHETSV